MLLLLLFGLRYGYGDGAGARSGIVLLLLLHAAMIVPEESIVRFGEQFGGIKGFQPAFRASRNYAFLLLLLLLLLLQTHGDILWLAFFPTIRNCVAANKGEDLDCWQSIVSYRERG